MILHKLIDASYQTFMDQAEGARVILLHPRSRYRSMLIAKLINAPEIKVYYYALGPDDINLQAFITGITHDLANQHPTFGRHINMLPQQLYQKPYQHMEQMLTAFANDVGEMSSDPFLFVLDEYDRSDTADDIQRFVEQLASKLPQHCRIIINSRTLPRLPWVSMIAQKQAILLEDDQVISTNFYGTLSEDEKPLEVFALGPGFVLTNGEPVDTWEGHLPRLLFFFALDRPVVTRSEICEAFWPELDADQAVNVFHVTKRRLHKALNYDVLVHDDGYYRVNPEMPVYYDVLEFVSALMEGRNSDDEIARFNAWQRASDLYRGPFLQGHNDDWIQERRQNFRAGYLEALTELAHIWIKRNRLEQALGLFQRALAEDQTQETVHHDIMRLYAQLGRRSEAAAHFQRLSEERRKLKQPLPQGTEAVYQEIMGG